MTEWREDRVRLGELRRGKKPGGFLEHDEMTKFKVGDIIIHHRCRYTNCPGLGTLLRVTGTIYDPRGKFIELAEPGEDIMAESQDGSIAMFITTMGEIRLATEEEIEKAVATWL